MFLFAFSGASELILFGTNLNLCWNCPAGTLELILFVLSSDRLWDLGFLGIPSRDYSLFPSVGVYSDYLFVENYIFPRWGFTILILSWGSTSITKRKIAYVTLNPIYDYVHMLDLITRLRVG